MPDHDELVCTLDPTDAPQRAIQAGQLRQHLLGRERLTDAVILYFSADAEPHVREFVRAESNCCSFFGFDIIRGDDHVLLEITAPPSAQPMLDGLIEIFDTGNDIARAQLFDTAARQGPPLIG